MLCREIIDGKNMHVGLLARGKSSQTSFVNSCKMLSSVTFEIDFWPLTHAWKFILIISIPPSYHSISTLDLPIRKNHNSVNLYLKFYLTSNPYYYEHSSLIIIYKDICTGTNTQQKQCIKHDLKGKTTATKSWTHIACANSSILHDWHELVLASSIVWGGGAWEKTVG